MVEPRERTASARRGRGRGQRSPWIYVGAGVLAAAGIVAVAVPLTRGGGSADTAAEPSSSASSADAAVLVSSPSASGSASASATAARKAKSTGYSPPSARLSKRPEASGLDPIAATPTTKAENIPAYPPDGGSGRRVVYSKALMHVWIVDDNDRVVRHYPVIGRWDRPNKGTYHVYSKSLDTMNTHSKVTFSYMVRFAWGKEDSETSIGFHNIPIHYDDVPQWDVAKGQPVSKPEEMGLPLASGGCVRAVDENARFLYYWSKVGDKVVVLPTAS